MSYADRVIRTQEAIGNLRTQGEQQSDEIQSDFLQRTGEILSDFHAKGQSLVDGSAAGLGGIAGVHAAQAGTKALMAKYSAFKKGAAADSDDAADIAGEGGTEATGMETAAATSTEVSSTIADTAAVVGGAEAGETLGGVLAASAIPGLQWLAVGGALFALGDGLYHLFHKEHHKAQSAPTPTSLTSIGANVTSQFSTALPTSDGVIDRAAQTTAF